VRWWRCPRCGWPQGDAEADQGDADGHRERAVEGLRQDSQREGGDGAVGEQQGRPAGQDAGPEERDAEQQPAEGVTHPCDEEQGLDSADVAGRGGAEGTVEVVLDVAGIGLGQRGEDAGDDDLVGEHREVPDRDEHVADHAECPELVAVADEHAGEPGDGEHGHRHLGDFADEEVGAGDVGEVGWRVIDLDAGVQDAGDGGAHARGCGQSAGGDGHLVSSVCGAGRDAPAVSRTLGIEVVRAHHHVM
jgi:hypothetical protein